MILILLARKLQIRSTIFFLLISLELGGTVELFSLLKHLTQLEGGQGGEIPRNFQYPKQNSMLTYENYPFTLVFLTNV